MFRLRRNLCLPAMLVAAVLVCSGSESRAHAQIAGQADLRATAASQWSVQSAQRAIVDIGDAVALGRRYETAIKIYSQAPQKSAEIWNKMGMTYELMLNSDAAVRCYKESLKLDANDPRVLNNLATLYVSMKEYGTADRLFRKALSIDPGYAGIYKNLGASLVAQHKFSESQRVFEQAAELDPEVLGTTVGPTSSSMLTSRERGAMNYFMAEACARTRQTTCALTCLRSSLDEGFADSEKVIADRSFAELAADQGFRKLLQASQ